MTAKAQRQDRTGFVKKPRLQVNGDRRTLQKLMDATYDLFGQLPRRHLIQFTSLRSP